MRTLRSGLEREVDSRAPSICVSRWSITKMCRLSREGPAVGLRESAFRYLIFRCARVLRFEQSPHFPIRAIVGNETSFAFPYAVTRSAMSGK